MTKNTILKGKIEHILKIKYKPDRKPLKDELKTWLLTQSHDYLMPQIEELNREELGIASSCGISGKVYRRAMELIGEYKVKSDRIGQETLTGENPLDEEKPLFDMDKGIEQLDPDLVVALIYNSSNETITVLAGVFKRVMTERGLIKEGD